jgi:D,D-heptose 1,7-bisphosphate phosphatase
MTKIQLDYADGQTRVVQSLAELASLKSEPLPSLIRFRELTSIAIEALKQLPVGVVGVSFTEEGTEPFWSMNSSGNSLVLDHTPKFRDGWLLDGIRPQSWKELDFLNTGICSIWTYTAVKGEGRALFLDRDGILIEDTGYPIKIDQIKPLYDVVEILKKAQAAKYKLIVLTNQSGIARGYFTLEQVNAFNQAIAEIFLREGVELTDWFVAPYHRDGKVAEFALHSHLRKPYPAMMVKACEKHDLCLEHCLMLGDRASDQLLGVKTPTYLVNSRFQDDPDLRVFRHFKTLVKHLPF